MLDAMTAARRRYLGLFGAIAAIMVCVAVVCASAAVLIAQALSDAEPSGFAQRGLWMVLIGGGLSLLLAVVYLIVDPLRRLRAEDDAQALWRARAEEVLRAMPDGMFLIDADFIIRDPVSPALLQVLQRKLWPGMDLIEVLRPMLPAETLDAVRAYLRLLFGDGGRDRRLSARNPLAEIVFAGPPSRQTQLGFRFERIERDGVAEYLLVSVSDIGDRLRLNKELAGAKLRLRAQIEGLVRVLGRDGAQIRAGLDHGVAVLERIRVRLQRLAVASGANERDASYRALLTEAQLLKREAGEIDLDLIETPAHCLELDLTELSDRADYGYEDGQRLAAHVEHLGERIATMRELLAQVERRTAPAAMTPGPRKVSDDGGRPALAAPVPDATGLASAASARSHAPPVPAVSPAAAQAIAGEAASKSATGLVSEPVSVRPAAMVPEPIRHAPIDPVPSKPALQPPIAIATTVAGGHERAVAFLARMQSRRMVLSDEEPQARPSAGNPADAVKSDSRLSAAAGDSDLGSKLVAADASDAKPPKDLFGRTQSDAAGARDPDPPSPAIDAPPRSPPSAQASVQSAQSMKPAEPVATQDASAVTQTDTSIAEAPRLRSDAPTPPPDEGTGSERVAASATANGASFDRSIAVPPDDGCRLGIASPEVDVEDPFGLIPLLTLSGGGDAVLTPAKAAFVDWAAHARRLAGQQGKSVRVEAVLDLFEQLPAPTMGILREVGLELIGNAVTHGVESMSMRRRVGKDPVGVVRLTLSRDEAGPWQFGVRDDGRGINLVRLRTALLRDGRYRADEVGRMSERDAILKVFESGVTTAVANDGSGSRGLGLPMVMERIRALQARMSLATAPGKSSEFRMRWPQA
ncbi:ATP-binding protein [Lysobacter sp. CA199]|uniref:ATP-binding protein n=1 Tax=Lysobacter sp. CA199 TaxID=3455608 RepID=UPI003F8D5039